MSEVKLLKGYRLIIFYLGVFMMLIGGIILLPLLVLPFYPNELDMAKFFILPGTLSIVFGYVIQFYFQHMKKGSLEKYQDATLVVFIWIIAIIIGSLPFFLTGNYTFIESLFEVTSGFSTTGLSVVDVNTVGHIFLIYRTILLFFGGLGFVIIITSAISDKMGMRLYFAEGHNDKLLPNLLKSARLMLSIYAFYIVAGIVAYVFAGMPVFDAINHAIASVSTGGFSTKTSSIGYYQSIPIEIITMILMLLGGTNFIMHLKLLTGKWKTLFKHNEIRFVLIALAIGIPWLTVMTKQYSNIGWTESMRIVSFQLISAITTTGFQTVPNFITAIPQSFITGVIICMIIGGGYGSTAGGIKQYRIALAFKATYWNIQSQMTHKNVIQPHYIDKYGQRYLVTDRAISANYSFIFIYFVVLMTGTMIIQSFGYNFQDALFEFASSLSTVGLSTGITGKGAHPVILLTSIFGMFLGRLEFYVIYIGLVAIFKKH